MSNTEKYVKGRIAWMHGWLVRAGEGISEGEFVHVFSPQAPPIGWHLWHMARFADRLQAKLGEVTEGEKSAEIWYRDELSKRWEISPDLLGVYETGMGQAHGDAQETIRQVGQAAIMEYAKAAFGACDAVIDRLTEADFDKTFHGLYDYSYDPATGKVWTVEPKASLVADDLVFHATHGSRHMGMMEALRGLLGSSGTLSV